MLYKLSDTFDQLEAVPFLDFQQHARLEHELETLIAKHLLKTLFEGSPLLPFHQERPLQAECDIYALDEVGDIVLFELKRSTATGDALDQLFRYTQKAGQWSYRDIARKFKAHSGAEFGDLELDMAHKEAFLLPQPLREEQFNRNQHMIVIGSAADEGLVRAVTFWKSKGLSIEFIPYRIYTIGQERFFEFFSKPHDVHTNPAEIKGVIFDTNKSYRPEAVRLMLEKKRVAAYGGRKDAVRSLKKNDYVFYCHSGVGLIAAAQVTGQQVRTDGDDELYWDVTLLTPVPIQFDLFPKFMSFTQIKQATGKNFYWANTLKAPYLSGEESKHLLNELRKVLA